MARSQCGLEGTGEANGIFWVCSLPMELDEGNPRWAGEVFDRFQWPVAEEGASQGRLNGGAGAVVLAQGETDHRLAANLGVGIGEACGEGVAQLGGVERGLFAKAEGGPVAGAVVGIAREVDQAGDGIEIIVTAEAGAYTEACSGVGVVVDGEQMRDGTWIVAIAEGQRRAAHDLRVGVLKQADEHRQAFVEEGFLLPAELAEDIRSRDPLGCVGAGREAATDFELGLAAAVVERHRGVDTGVGFPALAEEAGGQFFRGTWFVGVAGVVRRNHKTRIGGKVCD